MEEHDYLANFTTDMELRGLTRKSMKTYENAVSLFIKYCKEEALPFSEETFRSYLVHLLKNRKISKSTINLYNSAIRFFLEVTLGQNINYRRTARLRKEYHYPPVLSQEEVTRFLSVIDDVKYRAVFYNIYGSGLRASEAGHLRVSDVDSKNMRLLIRQGKGYKDRYTILSRAGLITLREYWKATCPSSEQDFLFPGKSTEGCLSVSGIEIAFRKYYAMSGIGKKATVHTLRHSFATHLLEAGVEPVFIKNLLGHSTFWSTNMYLHMANTTVYKTTSPLDGLLEHG